MRKAINILGTLLRIIGMILTIPSFLLSLPGMSLILIGEAIEEESIGNDKLASGIEEEHNNRQI